MFDFNLYEKGLMISEVFSSDKVPKKEDLEELLRFLREDKDISWSKKNFNNYAGIAHFSFSEKRVEVFSRHPEECQYWRKLLMERVAKDIESWNAIDGVEPEKNHPDDGIATDFWGKSEPWEYLMGDTLVKKDERNPRRTFTTSKYVFSPAGEKQMREMCSFFRNGDESRGAIAVFRWDFKTVSEYREIQRTHANALLSACLGFSTLSPGWYYNINPAIRGIYNRYGEKTMYDLVNEAFQVNKYQLAYHLIRSGVNYNEKTSMGYVTRMQYILPHCILNRWGKVSAYGEYNSGTEQSPICNEILDYIVENRWSEISLDHYRATLLAAVDISPQAADFVLSLDVPPCGFPEELNFLRKQVTPVFGEIDELKRYVRGEYATTMCEELQEHARKLVKFLQDRGLGYAPNEIASFFYKEEIRLDWFGLRIGLCCICRYEQISQFINALNESDFKVWLTQKYENWREQSAGPCGHSALDHMRWGR